MQRNTWIALGALIALGVLAFVTLRTPEKGQRVGPAARPIPALKAADVKQLELTSGNGKDHVVLDNDNGFWRLSVPLAFPADQGAVKTAVDQLEKIGFGDVVTENAGKFSELEVSDDRGAHVVARGDGAKVLFDAWLGKSSNGFTMLRPAGKQEVWQASGLFKYTFGKDPKQWRDHTVVDVNKDDVTKLTVEADGQKLVLERIPPAEKNAEPKWKVLETTVKVDPLDHAVANALVQTTASLRAADFDDAAKPADVGLAPPRVKVTVTTKAQPWVILVGKQKGDDSWVAVEGKPQIYLLQKYLMERLAVVPRNFRDKTLVKAKDADLVEIAVAQGADTLTLKKEGAAWKAGKGEVDDNKVKMMVGGFENVAGSSFADATDAKATGLGKPSATVTLKLRDKSQVVLKVGLLKDGTDYYVQKLGSPDVLLVKKYVVDRFLKKPSDLAKTAAPPAPQMPMQMPMQMPPR